MKTAVTSLNDFVSGVAERVEKVNNTVISVVNSTDVLITKVNAMLDVQSLVYQTIKDEATRTAVNNILTNAKYAVTAQRAELIKELNALKEETAKQNAENNARVEEAVAKAEAEKILVAARAEKEANELRQQALTPAILQKMWIERWDGHVPTVQTGSNSMFMDISKFVK